MTEEPTHHHMVADNVQIKLAMPAVDTKVISPEELQAGAIVQPEPWMVRHLMDHPELMRDLSPWEFQVYMAALLEKKWGRNVELGPRGKDGGSISGRSDPPTGSSPTRRPGDRQRCGQAPWRVAAEAGWNV